SLNLPVMKKLLLAITVVFAIACQQKNNDQVKDAHSFAKPDEAVVKHLDLDIKVDFDIRQISGKASWTIENLSGGNEIIFDTRDLQITRITLDDDEKEAEYTLGQKVDHLGQALQVTIEPNTMKVNIYYSNSPEAAAVQWLDPRQTAGKKFLFTQSQAI